MTQRSESSLKMAAEMATEIHAQWATFVRLLLDQCLIRADGTAEIPADVVTQLERQSSHALEALEPSEHAARVEQAMALLDPLERHLEALMDAEMDRLLRTSIPVGTMSAPYGLPTADHPYQRTVLPQGEAETMGQTIRTCCALPPSAHPPI